MLWFWGEITSASVLHSLDDCSNIDKGFIRFHINDQNKQLFRPFKIWLRTIAEKIYRLDL